MITRILAALYDAIITTLLLWSIAYVGRMPGLSIPSNVLGIGLLLLIVLAGLRAGRRWARPEAIRHGLLSGALLGAINLLAFGSLLSEPEVRDESPAIVALLVLGWIVACALLFGVGCIIGAGRGKAESPDARCWLAGIARSLVVAVFLLVVAGGIVTSTDTGMAVYDWPSTFEMHMFLFPLSKMTGGVFFEHAHRLWGSLIGLLTIFLVIGVFAVDKRKSVKIASIGLLIFVIAQGVLGGKRVIDNEITLALVHGVTGQLYLALTAMMAAWLSRSWLDAETPRLTDGRQFKLAIAFAIAMTLQVIVGAMVRHLGVSSHSIITHIVLALIVLVLAQILGFRSMKLAQGYRPLRRLGAMTAHTAGLQVILGVLALWVVTSAHNDSPIGVAFATAHQAVGAVLMLAAALQLVWSIRLRRPAASAAS